MIGKITYKQRLKVLPVLLILTFGLIYWIAIKDTLKLRNDCVELREQIVTVGDAPKELATLTNRLQQLSGVSGNHKNNTTTDPLLYFISTDSFSSNKLIGYLPLHLFKNQRYQLETRTAVFEGDFQSQLEFLFNLEKKYVSGKVVSVKFETETNVTTEKKRLLMTLYIQSVTNEKDTKTTTESNS